MERENDWGVFVNEASITATGKGTAWWAGFRAKYEGTPRMVCLNPGTGGNLWHVACDSRDEAEVVALVFTDDHDLPDGALKVKRLSQCDHLRSG